MGELDGYGCNYKYNGVCSVGDYTAMDKTRVSMEDEGGIKVDKELIEKQIKKQVKKQVAEALKDVLETFDIQEMLLQAIESEIEFRVDKVLEKGTNLEELMVKAVQPNVMQWAEQNMYGDDVKECVKSAMINRLSELSLSDLIIMGVKFVNTVN